MIVGARHASPLHCMSEPTPIGPLMAFVFLHDLDSLEPKDQKLRWNTYSEYLNSLGNRLPASAYSFAIADWHYDHLDSRCPHDSWVESITIAEPASGDRSQRRKLEIQLTLLGAYHNGYFKLIYRDVAAYDLKTPAEFLLPPRNVGHGDWLYDEVRLSDSGKVMHEIEFSRGSHWAIESSDILWTWQEIPSAGKTPQT